MPYQSKDWKINDIIKEDDLDRIEQGLQEFSEIAEQNNSAISNINNILEYINQNKSNELRSFLDQVINYIKIYATEKDYHLLPLSYLENVNCEETFNTKKWTELYNNVRFTLKYINCPNVVDEERIKEAFWEFELYYYISITIDM